MCIGLASGYRINRKLAMISCKKCGRTWQVTEESAKHFNEDYNGICPNCRSGEEKKAVSLLKRKTNNDKINEMSIDDKVEFLKEFCICEHCSLSKKGQCLEVTEKQSCTYGLKQWLESEAEE